jgi:hypothetical protein
VDLRSNGRGGMDRAVSSVHGSTVDRAEGVSP